MSGSRTPLAAGGYRGSGAALRTDTSDANVIVVNTNVTNDHFTVRLTHTQLRATSRGSDSLPVALVDGRRRMNCGHVVLSPMLTNSAIFRSACLCSRTRCRRLNVAILTNIDISTVSDTRRLVRLSGKRALACTGLMLTANSDTHIVPFPGRSTVNIRIFHRITSIGTLDRCTHRTGVKVIVNNKILKLRTTYTLATRKTSVAIMRVSSCMLGHRLSLPTTALLRTRLISHNVELRISTVARHVIAATDGIYKLLLRSKHALPTSFVMVTMNIIPGMTLTGNDNLRIGHNVVISGCVHADYPGICTVNRYIRLSNRLFKVITPIGRRISALISMLGNTLLGSAMLRGALSGGAILGSSILGSRKVMIGDSRPGGG